MGVAPKGAPPKGAPPKGRAIWSERVGPWTALTALGALWGVGAAWVYGASAARGVLVGTLLWGSALFVSLRGPHAPEPEILDLEALGRETPELERDAPELSKLRD